MQLIRGGMNFARIKWNYSVYLPRVDKRPYPTLYSSQVGKTHLSGENLILKRWNVSVFQAVLGYGSLQHFAIP